MEPADTTAHARSTLLAGVQNLLGFELPLAVVDAVLHADDPALEGLLGAAGIESGPVDPERVLSVGGPVVTDDRAGGVDPDTQRLLHETGADGSGAGPVVASLAWTRGPWPRSRSPPPRAACPATWWSPGSPR